MTPASSLDFRFEVDGADSSLFRVLRFQGREEISRLYRYEIALASDDPAIEFDEIVGKAARLSIVTGEEERLVSGIVKRFEETGTGRGVTYYTAHVVPRLWTLSLRRQARNFVGRTTPQILADVLAAAGIPADAVRTDWDRTYTARNYCVQYDETDLAFFCRVAERDGIAFCFEQTPDGEVLFLTDHLTSPPPIDGEPAVPFRDEGTGMRAGEEVTRFRFVQTVRPGAVTLRDWDFKKPADPIESEAESDTETQFECFDFPAGVPSAQIGSETADVRLEEERSRRLRGAGASSCRRLTPGRRFTLADHPAESLNQEYLLIAVEHWGSQPHAERQEGAGAAAVALYENVFECVPSGTHYRPDRTTPVPRIRGPQPAVVVGPGGEIETDDHGRVKVRFPWDRAPETDGSRSPWIRVSQGWAGEGWGNAFLPRIGHEVLVEYFDGDVDRPLVTGRVYNGQNQPPYVLPFEKTKSAIRSSTTPVDGTFNEIRFEDKAAEEELFINASKDMAVRVENNVTQKVGVHSSGRVGKNRTVKVGGNQTETANRHIGGDVGGDDSLSIGGSEKMLVVKPSSVSVTGNRTEKVGAASIEIVAGPRTTGIAGSLTTTVGALSLEIVKGSKTVSVGTVASFMCAAAEIVNVKGAQSTNVKAAYSLVTTALSQKAGGNATLNANGKCNIVAGGIASLDAGTAIVLKCGDSTVTIDGSGVALKSAKITLEASGAIKLTSSVMKAN